jgi:DNA-binding response OmpR family regulator
MSDMIGLPARPPPVILLVDGRRPDYAIALRAAGFQVIPTPSVQDALRSTMSPRPDLLVVELELPQQNVKQLTRLLGDRTAERTMAVLLLGRPAMENAAHHVGATFCPCPCAPDVLVETVRQALAGRAPEGRVPEAP